MTSCRRSSRHAVKRRKLSLTPFLFALFFIFFFVGVAPLKPEFSGPKEKIVPIPDGSSFFILGKKNW